MLLDQGVLREREGRYHLDGELGPLAIPGTLAGLLGSRLDGLTEPERMLIGHGAVLGHSFTVDALAAASGHSPEHLGATLDALVRKEILDLDEDPRSPERGQYHFVQGLIREVAYERLAKRDRLARHLAAARYFEELDDPELAGIVTTHYLEAHRLSPEGAERDEIAAKARTTLLDAAARSRDLHAYAGRAALPGAGPGLRSRIPPTSARSWPGSLMRHSTEPRSSPSSTGPRGSRAALLTRRGPPATRPPPPARTRRWRPSSRRTTTRRRPGTSCARRWTNWRAGRRMRTWFGSRPSSGAPT